MTVRYKLVQVPEDLHEILRLLAFGRGTTITAQTEEVLRPALEKMPVPQVTIPQAKPDAAVQP